jgi:hypothetical protein
MTVIQKLSDRESIIFKAIKLILVNVGNMNLKQLQWELFNRGIFIDDNLLKQAISVMNEKGLITKPDKKDVEPVQKEAQAGIQS